VAVAIFVVACPFSGTQETCGRREGLGIERSEFSIRIGDSDLDLPFNDHPNPTMAKL
jgi:hypothetical protein